MCLFESKTFPSPFYTYFHQPSLQQFYEINRLYYHNGAKCNFHSVNGLQLCWIKHRLSHRLRHAMVDTSESYTINQSIKSRDLSKPTQLVNLSNSPSKSFNNYFDNCLQGSRVYSHRSNWLAWHWAVQLTLCMHCDSNEEKHVFSLFSC